MSALLTLLAAVGFGVALWCTCGLPRLADKPAIPSRAEMEADLFRPVSEWIAEAEAEAEREWMTE